MTPLDIHPLAELMPTLPDAEQSELIADIIANGQREPIVIYEGKILDGRHRYKACVTAGVAPLTRMYDGPDPVGVVISENILRRHLSARERAMLVIELNEWRTRGGQSASEAEIPTETELANQAQTSRATIQRVKSEKRRASSDPDEREREVTANEEREARRASKESKRKAQVHELTEQVHELTDKYHEVTERLAVVAADGDTEAANRESVYSSQRARIQHLEGEAGRWQIKHRDAIKTAESFRRKYRECQAQYAALAERARAAGVEC